MPDHLLQLRLSVDYPSKPGVLREAAFEIGHGEVLGLVGESGSGKSTVGLAILRLLDSRRAKVHGAVRFFGRDLLALSEREMRAVRGNEIGLVLQSPIAALNPALRIGTQLQEAWRCHSSNRDWKPHVLDTLRSVSLPGEESLLQKYPRELSVGLAQRVLIAMAILHRPRLLIADEATSALDVITQAEILELFGRLSRDLGMAILFISHDLPAVATLADRVAILDQGEIVEVGSTSSIFERPRHPYTRRLIAALPQFGARSAALV